MADTLRTLTSSDLSSAIELSVATGWNQTREDWQRLMRLAPDGCRCIELDGKIAATTTRLNYGTQLAWIGMVLTRPENRRQGLARRLVEDAIVGAEHDGVRTLKLDATDQGRPLYENLGFVVEHEIERWERKGSTDICAGLPRKSRLDDELLKLDVKSFGVDRRELLQDLVTSGSGEVSADGYLLSRSGRVARYLGPCVAASAESARELITAHLESSIRSCTWYWDLEPGNADAAQCAKELGFTRSRVLWRMRRGDAIRNDGTKVFAIAGFELG